MLNPSKIKFKVKVNFKFEDIEEAIKVRNLLKKCKYEVSSIIEPQVTYDHRGRRLKFILNNLMAREEPVSMGCFFSKCYGTNFDASYRTFARDVAILILQDKIKATVNIKGKTTLIEYIKND